MGRNIKIMGIINVNNDSYFDGSRCPGAEQALARAEKLVAEGADILDIGSCSTRPGSEPPSCEEEWRRLEGALKAVRKHFPDVRISIDTFRSEVVRRTFDTVGDHIVNDISAGEADERMLATVGRLGLDYVAMHMRGTPKTMNSLCSYDDVTEDVLEYFRGFEKRMAVYGIRDYILDPGFGFAKTVEQNYELLHRLDRFRTLGRRILVGVSRKSMIYRHFGITPQEALPATQVLHMEALIRGADILRVHDVAEARRCAEIYGMMYGKDGGAE